MRKDLSKKRIFMVSGHAHSGKTTLSEAVLFKTKSISQLGKIEGGNTLSDYSEDEISRRSSINNSFLLFNHKGTFVQFIDTPGYSDFIGELISASFASDFAVIVIDASAGVEVGTERAWDIIRRRNIPCLFFVNKLDKDNTSFEKAIGDIKSALTKKAVSLVCPLGRGSEFKESVSVLDKQKTASLSGEYKDKAEIFYSKLIENIAESNDALLEKYLESGSLELSEAVPALKEAVLKGEIFPVLAGSGAALAGIDTLLDTIIDIMPDAGRLPRISAKKITGEEISVERKVDSLFSAQVVKTISDSYVGQLSIFRIFSGELLANSGFYNSTKGKKERITQLYLLQGKEQKPVETVYAGEIAAVAKLKDTGTSDTLSDDKNRIMFAPISFPEATYSASVKPKTRQDEEKISQALYKLSAEDPTFKVGIDSQTKELIVSGTGELHIKVIIGRIKDRFGTEVELGKPKVPYKETITKSVQVQGKYKKQTGGHGQYGDVWIEITPLERGKDFEFVDKIVGGSIPRNFIPSVEKGIRNCMKDGFLAGYPISDLRVTLFDGSYHPVDSSDIAFQIAGAMALKKALEQARPVLLEPVMDVEIYVPEEFMGQVTGDINARRGRVQGMDTKGNKEVVKAKIPLAEMFKYASDLRSVTGGRGSYSMSFSHYDIVPQRITQMIIDKAAKAKEESKK